MKFTLTFTQDQITPARKNALEEIAAKTTIKGFRPGKAPLDRVEQAVSQEKVIEETVSHLIPTAYTQYIKEHDLKPITQPKISFKKMVNDGEWEFEIEIAEKPEVVLNNYIDAIKGERAKSTIWTPGKDETSTPTDDKKALEAEETKHMTMVFDTLLKTCQVDIADLLIEEEVNRALARLVDQVNKLGLTVDQYLASLGKKPEELREEYKQTAHDNLKLEFILDAIAKDQNIDASEAEINDVFKQVPDPKTVEAIKNNAYELASIKYNLVKHKVVDYLMGL